MTGTVESIQLSKILDLIVGTEDYIKSERMLAITVTNIINIDGLSLYLVCTWTNCNWWRVTLATS